MWQSILWLTFLQIPGRKSALFTFVPWEPDFNYMPFVHTTDGTFNTVEPCLELCIAIEPECNLAIFDPVSMDCFLGNLLLEVDLMATNLGHEQIVMVRTGNIYISKKRTLPQNFQCLDRANYIRKDRWNICGENCNGWQWTYSKLVRFRRKEYGSVSHSFTVLLFRL